MISKKLFKEVMGEEQMYSCLNIETNEIELDENINIYELAHKCKEWAMLQCVSGYIFSKYINFTTYQQWQVVVAIDEKTAEFTADTEPESIFKACEWILKDEK